MKTKGLKIDRDSHVGMRAFRQRTHDSFEPVVARIEFTIYYKCGDLLTRYF